jgi:hypothetical protein
MQDLPFDPRVFLRRFHDTYVNFAQLWKRFGVPSGVVLRSPADQPIPPPSSTAAAAFEDLQGKAGDVRFVKYMRSVNGKPSLVVEDESDLPPMDGLVVVTLTTSIVSATTHHIVSDVYVGERRR